MKIAKRKPDKMAIMSKIKNIEDSARRSIKEKLDG